MDRPNDRLNRFIANSGAGVDAAGRPVYSGPGMMYMGPGEFSRTQQVHNQLKADAASSDPQGHLIRELLDKLNEKSMAGKANIPVYPIAPGGDIQIDNRGN
jgi:hypothetical protein